MSEEMDRVRLLVCKKFEYDVAQNQDAWLHNHLLMPYLLLQVLDELKEINTNLEAIDSRLTDIDSSLAQLDNGRNTL